MADFDLLVIGAGAAGLSVAAFAAQVGLRVALAERGKMGGDCLNTGCVPSKALIAAAAAASDGAEARRFGVSFAPARIDWAAVQRHVHGVIGEIAPTDSEERFAGLGVTVIRGEARFCAPDAARIGGRVASAKRIVVAAGSRALIPSIPGLADVPYLTNDTMFELAERPRHLLILGGGPIGLEMAQAHAGLGVRVTVLESGTIAGRDDPELADVIRAALRSREVELREGVKIVRVESGPALVLEDGSRIEGSHLLVAAGRRPNTETLDAEAGGVALTARGIATDAGLRSLTNRRVFAAGDIADPEGIGPRNFTHVCGYHASILARRLIYRLPARVDYSALPRVIYTDPELAQVGMTEAEARESGIKFTVLRWDLCENDRARTERRTRGMAKIVVAPGGRILGAGFAAPHAGEAIGAWTLAISRKIPISAMAGMIVPYPTYAEIGKRAAGTFYTARLFSPLSRRIVQLLSRLP